AGNPARRGQAEWFVEVYDRLDIRPGSHLRRIHYVIISQREPILKPDGEPYQNTLEDFGMLGNGGRDARDLGLLPALSFVDRRNPGAEIYLTTEANYSAAIEFAEGSISQSVTPSDYHAPRIFMPSFTLVKPRIRQPVHIEIWCEKSTMNDVL